MRKVIRRPNRALYKTPEDLQAAVDRYFAQCKRVPLFDRDGTPVVNSRGYQKYRWDPAPPSMAGLSLFLGFKDRRLFTRQKYRGAAFMDVVLSAQANIQKCKNYEFYEYIERDRERGYTG